METRTDTLTPGSATRPGGNTPQAGPDFLGVTPQAQQGKGGEKGCNGMKLRLFVLEQFLEEATNPVAICDTWKSTPIGVYHIYLTLTARWRRNPNVIVEYREYLCDDMDKRAKNERFKKAEKRVEEVRKAVSERYELLEGVFLTGEEE